MLTKHRRNLRPLCDAGSVGSHINHRSTGVSYHVQRARPPTTARWQQGTGLLQAAVWFQLYIIKHDWACFNSCYGLVVLCCPLKHVFHTKKRSQMVFFFKWFYFLFSRYRTCLYQVLIHQRLAAVAGYIYTNISNNSIEHLTEESLLETTFLHFVHKVDPCTQVYFAIVIIQCKRSVIWAPYNHSEVVGFFHHVFLPQV